MRTSLTQFLLSILNSEVLSAVFGSTTTPVIADRRLTDAILSDVAVVALRRAGKPLTTAELRKYIEEVRGLNAVFLPQPYGLIGRLGRGVWGLVDRDFGLTPT